MRDYADIQGIVASGHLSHRASLFCLLKFENPAQLKALLGEIEINVAQGESADAFVFNVAVTSVGLSFLGLTEKTICTFAPEFQLGMRNGVYADYIGDTGRDHPDQWSWSDQDSHVALFVYSKTTLDSLPVNLKAYQSFVVFELATNSQLNEPFGFRDGISNPRPIPTATNAADVSLGEFVLGHADNNQNIELAPYVSAEYDRKNFLSPAEAHYHSNGKFRNLGRNGSYLAIRQLAQHPKIFESYTDGVAAKTEWSPEQISAKLIGREKNGTPLTPLTSGELSFSPADSTGQYCPVGSHVRRAHPRDSLKPPPEASLASTEHHRILRRGRSFDDGKQKGILFVCLQASISRQFEQVQKVWLRNTRFTLNGGESDPLTAIDSDGGQFSIVRDGIAHRLPAVPKLSTVIGGGFFFLPSLSCVRFLENLPD